MELFDGQDPNTVTLEVAKQWLRDRYEAGAHCPLCHQFAKLYKRKLNAAMAYVLVLIYRWHKTKPEGHLEWLHVPSHIAKEGAGNARRAAAVRGDWAKLKHWGLIQEQPGRRSDESKRMGYYRITDRGIAFVNGQITVQSHIWIYNETMLDLPVFEKVSIRDTLGLKFNYADLMGR